MSETDFDAEQCCVFTKAGQLPLLPREPNDYIVWYKSELRAPAGDASEEDDSSRLIATADWALVKCTSAANDEQALFEVFDAESQDLMTVYEVIVSPEDDSFKPFDGWGDLLYFHGIEVEPGFDAREVCREFIDHVLRYAGNWCGAVFIFGVHDRDELREAFIDRGFKKFQQVVDMEIYTLDGAIKLPPLPPLARERANVSALDPRAREKG